MFPRITKMDEIHKSRIIPIISTQLMMQLNRKLCIYKIIWHHTESSLCCFMTMFLEIVG